MEILFDGLIVLALLLFFLGAGVWITAGLLLTAVLSLMLVAGYPVGRIGAISAKVVLTSASKWELSAIPLFIFMGEMMFRSDIAERIFRGLRPLIGGLPGGLLHANVIGSAMFAAVTGSSSATTATVGKITLPLLKREGYNWNIAIGALAAAGGLGLLIPPSIMLIIYGVIVEVSIVDLFAAGIFPGILIASLFSIYIAVRYFIDNRIAPRSGHISIFKTGLGPLLDLLPVAFLMFLVLGGIYSGLATPSEAAAVGVGGTILVLLLILQLTLNIIKKSALGAILTSCMITTIMISASVLSTAMALIHIPQNVAGAIGGLDVNPFVLIAIIALFYIVLGCLLDGISIAVMTLPITFPIVVQAGFDPVWYGIFVVVMVEVGLLTPPVGLNIFVLHGLTGDPIGRIVRATFPFLLLMLFAVALLVAFPQIALWLPHVLGK